VLQIAKMTVSSLWLTLVLLLPGCLASQDEEIDFMNVQIGGRATLNCESAADKWTFTKNDSTEIINADEEHYVFSSEDMKKLIVQDIQNEHIGLYKCMSGDDTVIKTFELDSNFKVKKLPKSISVDDGTPDVEIACSLRAAAPGQDIEFHWYTLAEDGKEGSRSKLCTKGTECSESGAQAEALFDKRDKTLPVEPLEKRSEVETGINDGIPFSKLKLSPVYTDDRQIYICQALLVGSSATEDCKEASNKECDETQVLLRVKDPLAALYPFVGIVVEVILLCIVIFFCERNKSDDKDDYEEVAGNGNSMMNSNSSLRQRK